MSCPRVYRGPCDGSRTEQRLGAGRGILAGFMRVLTAVFAILSVAAPAPSPVFIEAKSGVPYATKIDDMSLLGVALRTKSFLRFKVYALGLYVADSALSGPLAVHRGNLGSPAFYRDLIVGDFDKQFVLKLVRDLSAEQIQGNFRSHLTAANPKLVDQFVSYFGATKAGQECALRWVAARRQLETTVGGVEKTPIADKAFADEVFAIWLRDRPAEDAIRRPLISRAGELIR
jgi:Chalcone isomerase-like